MSDDKKNGLPSVPKKLNHVTQLHPDRSGGQVGLFATGIAPTIRVLSSNGESTDQNNIERQEYNDE
ncbi:MAG: hypothetical protein VB878_13580, partial [Pirellulaceae bacterium]